MKIFKSLANEQTSVPVENGMILPSTLIQKPNPNISLQDAILTRRTVRSYESKMVPFNVFEEMIRLSMNSPTACNEQRWRILYLDKPEIFNELYLRGSAAFVKKTKQAFIILYNNHTDNLEYKDHIQSAAAFINTFSLVSHSLGIGSCWVGHLPNKGELQRFFNIHKLYEPVAMVTFGYYRKKVKIKPRKKDPQSIIDKNTFDGSGLVFSKSKNVFIRRIFRKLYYILPPFFRRQLRSKSLPFEKKFYNELYD
jgi:nitroreductase|tara:strand:- start:19 stop:777 length:759 start_codon:yes stop_codon:yes gene_type:complete